ncbi:Vacuolar protein sorting-associated protein 72-like protein, partial [Stegodyphus mimosarum]
MLATTRQKRANAGNRMATLLENEEADDFYSSAYGGFQDEADDVEYSEEEEESEDTDSDISLDEKDEPVSDPEEEEKAKRKHRVVTKAYKEPPKMKVKKEAKKVAFKMEPVASASAPVVEKKQMRESTTLKSLEAKQRTQAKENKKSQESKKKQPENYPLTQEQLLEEAKITELKNLKSLEMFQRLELEKKKTKLAKHACTEPMIRYHSVAMPLVEVVEDENKKQENIVVGRCTRNFITFPDENTMKEYFNFEKPKPVTKSTCIVTRMPARYFDPLTKQPSANLTAFRIIREAYYTQLEKKVDSRLPHVAKWLEWRKQMKAAKQSNKNIKTH